MNFYLFVVIIIHCSGLLHKHREAVIKHSTGILFSIYLCDNRSVNLIIMVQKCYFGGTNNQMNYCMSVTHTHAFVK